MSFAWFQNTIDWCKDQLKEWGFTSKEATIIIVGLENTGKTTLYRMLIDRKEVNLHYIGTNCNILYGFNRIIITLSPLIFDDLQGISNKPRPPRATEGEPLAILTRPTTFKKQALGASAPRKKIWRYVAFLN